MYTIPERDYGRRLRGCRGVSEVQVEEYLYNYDVVNVP